MSEPMFSFLSVQQVRELDRLCAEVARAGFGRVSVTIEQGAPKFFETATTMSATARQRPPPPREPMR